MRTDKQQIISVLKGFIKLNDISLATTDKSISLFSKILAHVKTENWITFFETYPQLFDKLISAIGNSKQAKSIEQLTAITKINFKK